jgi:hypothetical protein
VQAQQQHQGNLQKRGSGQDHWRVSGTRRGGSSNLTAPCDAPAQWFEEALHNYPGAGSYI